MKLSRKYIRMQAAQWLAEDLGPDDRGDITTGATIDPRQKSTAYLRAKQPLVLCGMPPVKEIFSQVDKKVRFYRALSDGSRVAADEVIAQIKGPTASILIAERTALNILMHLSGIATLTDRYVAKVKGTRAKILDTRKTTPGLRLLEKYAVAVGGGRNHRLGLYDMVLIKDNHIRAAGSIAAAVAGVKARGFSPKKIQVEVSGLGELDQALAAGAGLILLDNMSPQMMRQAVLRNAGRAQLEASGNVNLRRLRAIAETGVDRISIGALTHSAPAADIHLKLAE